MQQAPTRRRLGDILGSVRYMGCCPVCRTQHMSRNAFVGPKLECDRCLDKAKSRP